MHVRSLKYFGATGYWIRFSGQLEVTWSVPSRWERFWRNVVFEETWVEYK